MAKKDLFSYGSSLRVWALLRLALGFTLLWAFADKLIGLGFSTCYDKKADVINVMCSSAVAAGGSPTQGWLNNATRGPLQDFYQGMAGVAIVDFLFMAGLLLIGVSLMLGIGMKVATVSGSVLMLMMWSATLLPANNPILDEHIIYVLVLVGLFVVNKDQVWGLGKWWQGQSVVKRFKFLE